MTVLSNVSLFYQNASFVFTSQNAYTSMELYFAVLVLFSIFMVCSLALDGQKKPFEKLFSAIMAFLFAFSNALASFSLAIVTYANAGFVQQTGTGNIVLTQQQAIIPVIIMQNTMTWQVVSWILLILCFINIINCILVLIDYSKLTGVRKGAL
jgi:hypothetical protein